MQDNKKLQLQYYAGICFALFGIVDTILGCIGIDFYYGIDTCFYVLDFWDWAFFVGFILVAVSLFSSVPVLSIVGFGVVSLVIVCETIRHHYWNYWFSEFLHVHDLLYCVTFVILVLACICKKQSRKLSAFAGGVMSLSLILYLVDAIPNHTFYNAWSLIRILLRFLLIIAGSFLFSRTYSEMQPKEKKTISSKAQSSLPTTSDTIERLSNLKSLLDNGIITQEEFDAKKKEIII